MADPLPLAEIEFRIALLPPISRGAHLSGPLLHARRLVELWAVDEDGDVPLTQAFRLLDVDMIAEVVLRTTVAGDYPGDPRYWTLPPFKDMLPELQECAWQAALAGGLLVDGVRETRRRQVLTTELPRLIPDWRLSRLVRDECDGCDGQIGRGDGEDEFIDVRVRRAPAEPVKATWKPDKPAQADVNAAMDEIAKAYPSAEEYSKDTTRLRPPFDEIWGKLEDHLGKNVSRQQARDALDRAPHLRGQKGYSSKKSKSPN